jgi:hypothetical protein
MKIGKILLIVAMVSATIVGCGSNASANEIETPIIAESQAMATIEAVPLAAGNNEDAAESVEFTTEYEFSPEDSDNEWGNGAATVILLDGDSAQVSGAGAGFSGGILTINQAGTYVLSGSLAGRVLIDAAEDNVVRVVLNGAEIYSANDHAIYAPSGKVVIILADGTENSVSDGAARTDNNINAAIYARNNLSITGGGSLRVEANHHHAIRSQGILAVTDGEFEITAPGNAFRGRDGVAISGGTFTLVTEGDTIESSRSNDNSRGFIIVYGGEFNIRTQNDGFQAESSLIIYDGQFNILTGGGSANAPERPPEMRGGRDFRGEMSEGFEMPEDFGEMPDMPRRQGGQGGRGEMPQRGEMPEGFEMPQRGEMPGMPPAFEPVEAEDSVSMKALKGNGIIIINGGVFIIDAEDDAINSNGDIIITGGDFTIGTGDDGIAGDGDVLISGGVINILTSYEGIEGMTVTIEGGDITVFATDDGINASDPASVGRAAPGRGNDRLAIRIKGGTIHVHSLSDGLDSNGNIYMEGGSLFVSGLSMGMEGAIEQDGVFVVSGGEVVTSGSIQNVSGESSQPVIYVSYSEPLPAGSVIEIRDTEGNMLLQYACEIAALMSHYSPPSFSFFTSPAFETGGTYGLYVNDEKRTDITLNEIITYISDDGSEFVPGGRGGPGGGMPGRGNMPGIPERGEMPDINLPEPGQMPNRGGPGGTPRGR